MNRKNMIVFFIAILFLVGACSFSARATQVVPPTSNPPTNSSMQETATQPPINRENGQGGAQAATQPPLPAGNGQGGPQTDIQESFPVAPDSQMTSPGSNDPNDPSGSFNIQSQSTPEAVAKFYADTLPAQGWTLRYTDANFTGGVTQYWKKDNTYLSMDIGFDQGQLRIHCQYDRVEAQLAQKLPKDFPLPAQFEMVSAEDTSWEFYIPQDYAGVTSFYTQKLSAMNWKQAPENGAGGQGSCGGTDCGGSTTFPAGAMPTATIDYRNENDLSFTMPDGNVIELTISPHQNGTILYVDLTLNNIASAGLPQDVPIYPGAAVQLITPGTAEFQTNADLKTVKNYYIQQLTTAGWSQDGDPINASGSYLQNWAKGDQKITIMLVPSGDNTILNIECSTCNP
jgi:hypothetical protein